MDHAQTSLHDHVEKIISQMSLQEKAAMLSGQDNWRTFAHPHLGIPSLVMTDGPHGVRTGPAGHGRVVGKATAFPTGISMAATWNPELIEQAGEAIANETRALECDIILGPCVNIVRSPLGGRNFETYSEDPFLAGKIGIGYVKGVQKKHIGTSLKHFAANNQEVERFRGNSVVDERTLREIYLPAFEMIVKEAQPWTVMCSYNRINGHYASENSHLLTEILRDEWGFEGVVVSDWGAVHNTVAPIQAGLDIEMPGPARFMGGFVESAVNTWQLDENSVNQAVKRILKMVFASGKADDPNQLPAGAINTPEHQQVARRVAEESITLLKNENDLLPLDEKKIKSLAVIGLNANREITGGGSSYVDASYWVTPLEGIQNRVGSQINVAFEPGYDNRENPPVVEAACFFQPDGKTSGLKAEFFNNLDCAGEPVLTRIDPTIDFWWGFSSPDQDVIKRDAYSARFTGKFIPQISGETTFYLFNTGNTKVYLDGKLLMENNVGHLDHMGGREQDIKMETPCMLTAGKSYDFVLEFSSGLKNEFALLFFRHLTPLVEAGDPLEAAAALAKRSDAAIVFAGLQLQAESEGDDRKHMDLPGNQEALIRAVVAANPNTIVVVNSGAPVTMPWADAIPAILQAYYPGQEGGNALAAILFGDVNPSGKLTVTFPKRLIDNPAYINYPGGKEVRYGEGIFVGYRYYDIKDVAPLFAFGHGLSYTSFDYTGLQVPEKATAAECIKVAFTVKNSGKRAGKEVCQLYVRDVTASVQRPVKELKGFAKIELQAGESREIVFELNERAFAFYDTDKKGWVVEAGDFEIMVGSSSRDIRLSKTIAIG